MTGAQDAQTGTGVIASPAPDDRNVRRVAAVRVAKLTRLVLPPGHAAVQDVMTSIWVDGLGAGFQLTGLPEAAGLTVGLADDVCERLENAELCSEYAEFPELDDRDFEDLAYERVHQLSRNIHPVGHPEVSGDTVEIWMDGVGAALRIVRHALTQ